MDAGRAAALRAALRGSAWVERTTAFARSLRGAGHRPGGLLLVGTPEDEPWHLTAHLADEARFGGLPELTPTLVRHAPPPGAPAHLAIGLERLEQAGRGETLFVVAPTAAPDALLERVDDARRSGAVVLAVDGGDPQLEGLAHDALTVPPPGSYDEAELRRGARRSAPQVDFDLATHLVSVAAGSADERGGRWSRLLGSLRG